MRALKSWFCILLAFAAVPASSQQAVMPFVDWDRGEWHVYRLDENDCWMVRSTADGGHLSISVARKDRGFYLAVAKPMWAIAVGGPYPVQVRFGKVAKIFNARRIHGFEPATVSMSTRTSGTDFPALLRARDISFLLPGGERFQSPLDPAALRAFSGCATSLGGVASAVEQD